MTLPDTPTGLTRAIGAADLTCEDVCIHGPAGPLHLRRRAPLGDVERPLLLMVHGSTYPASSTFDLPIQGASMMQVLALGGVDAWSLDVTGYGGSFRPPAMEQAPSRGEPISRTHDAAADVKAAVDFLRERFGRPSLALLGWSWGTSITGLVAAAHPDLVERLVLLAPQWLRESPSFSDPGGAIGAYRTIAAEGLAERWLAGVPTSARAEHIPEGALESLAASLLAADPAFSARYPGHFRAPAGTVADSREYWAAGRPLYDPGAIRCSVLVVHGEWDAELPAAMARRFFELLTGAPFRQLLEISSSTHSLVLERNRRLVFEAIITSLHLRHDPADWG